MTRRTLMSSAAIVLSACAASPNALPPVANSSSPRATAAFSDHEFEITRDVRQYSRDVAMSVDSAQRRVLAFYQGVGIQAAVLTRDPRVVGNERVQLRRTLNGRVMSTYLDCGTSPSGVLANFYRIQASVLTGITPKADGTASVSTRLTAIATSNDGASGGSVDCSSTGALEKELIASFSK